MLSTSTGHHVQDAKDLVNGTIRHKASPSDRPGRRLITRRSQVQILPPPPIGRPGNSVFPGLLRSPERLRRLALYRDLYRVEVGGRGERGRRCALRRVVEELCEGSRGFVLHPGVVEVEPGVLLAAARSPLAKAGGGGGVEVVDAVRRTTPGRDRSGRSARGTWPGSRSPRRVERLVRVGGPAR